jgi:hypothetical protein
MPVFGQSLWTALGEAGEPIWDEVKAPPIERSAVPAEPFFSAVRVDPDALRADASVGAEPVR